LRTDLFFRIRIEFKKISPASQRKNAAYGGGKSNAGSNIHKPALQRFGRDMREIVISGTPEPRLKTPSYFVGVFEKLRKSLRNNGKSGINRRVTNEYGKKTAAFFYILKRVSTMQILENTTVLSLKTGWVMNPTR